MKMELIVSELDRIYTVFKKKAICGNVARSPIGRFDSPNLCAT